MVYLDWNIKTNCTKVRSQVRQIVKNDANFILAKSALLTIHI